MAGLCFGARLVRRPGIRGLTAATQGTPDGVLPVLFSNTLGRMSHIRRQPSPLQGVVIAALMVLAVLLISALFAVVSCTSDRQQGGYDAAVDWNIGPRQPSDRPAPPQPSP